MSARYPISHENAAVLEGDDDSREAWREKAFIGNTAIAILIARGVINMSDALIAADLATEAYHDLLEREGQRVDDGLEELFDL